MLESVGPLFGEAGDSLGNLEEEETMERLDQLTNGLVGRQTPPQH